MRDNYHQLPVQRLNNGAVLPTRGSQNAAGLDLYASSDISIPARGKGLVSTGLAIAVPEGHYGRIAPRSGFSTRNHADIGAGVIDADYRGEIMILVFNHKRDNLIIQEGDRVAQLILEKITQAHVVESTSLPETQRDTDGFGSTGV